MNKIASEYLDVSRVGLKSKIQNELNVHPVRGELGFRSTVFLVRDKNKTGNVRIT